MEADRPAGDTDQGWEQDRIRGLAGNLRHKAPAAYLASCAGPALSHAIPPESYDLYLQGLLREANPSGDPLQALLIEQAVVANHVVQGLFVRATHADTAEAAVALYGAATRLLAESRRSILAVKSYRAPAAGQAVTVNVAAAGDQRVVIVGDARTPQATASRARPNELTSNAEGVVPYGSQSGEEPAPRRGGAEERPQTRPPLARRA